MSVTFGYVLNFSDLQFWTPGLVQVSYEFGYNCLSVGLFVCLQYKISKMADKFFLIFCMMLGSHNIRKKKPNFWKKSPGGLGEPKLS